MQANLLPPKGEALHMLWQIHQIALEPKARGVGYQDRAMEMLPIRAADRSEAPVFSMAQKFTEN